MRADHLEFVESVALPLGCCYLAAAVLNVGALVRGLREREGRWAAKAIAWGSFAILFGLLGLRSLLGSPAEIPYAVKMAIDSALSPITCTMGSFATLAVLFAWRRFFVQPAVAWIGFNASLLFLGASLADQVFASVVTRPDNVPIVAMVYLLAFFTWLGARQAVENDRRLDNGQPPREKDASDTVLVWPDLVYIELICMVLVSVVLIVWSIVLQAPLEEPANPMLTPNPSKAPWYFLGLQEMLIFFDASIAGVTLPVLIILGLAAIPYLDFNPRGSGYYTITQRKFAYVVFLFGFLQLWILLILIGTFMRGPNWSFFGPYEFRDPHKVMALNNVKLSEYFWTIWLGTSLPRVDPAAGGQWATILWREILGIVLLAGYFVGLPLLLGRTLLQEFRQRMNPTRYWIMTLLLLTMLMLPIKMILHWTMNLSYIVSMPEYFFNF